MHPIAKLQDGLVAALLVDEDLVALIGEDGVFDAPPKGKPAPYVVIDRHDMRQRDGDAAVFQEHRVMLHCWAGQPSRKAALAIAERVTAVGLALSGVTHAEHVRTEIVIDGATGQARAGVVLRFFSE